MKKIIKIRESEIKKIVEIVLEQTNRNDLRVSGYDTRTNPSDYLGSQGVVGAQQSKQTNMIKFQTDLVNELNQFSCVPLNVRFFPLYVKKNKKTLMQKLGCDDKTLVFLTKLALGIMNRETKFGTFTKKSDQFSEFLGNNYLSFLIPPTQSLGIAQFTKRTWNDYNLDKIIGPFGESFGSVNAGLGVMFRLMADYKTAIKNGAGTGISQNPIALRQGKIKNIKGTGNNAWDLSIVAHNFGSSILTSWCETNDPNYAGPCGLRTYKPFEKSKPNFVLQVNQSKKIPNYFPNKSSGPLTSIGYLEGVVSSINLSCIDF